MTYYAFETNDVIGISDEPHASTVFFSDDFDLVYHWMFYVVPNIDE